MAARRRHDTPGTIPPGAGCVLHSTTCTACPGTAGRTTASASPWSSLSLSLSLLSLEESTGSPASTPICEDEAPRGCVRSRVLRQC